MDALIWTGFFITTIILILLFERGNRIVKILALFITMFIVLFVIVYGMVAILG